MSSATRPARSNGRNRTQDASTVAQVRSATECSEDDARAALAECSGDAQQAVLYLLEGAFVTVEKKKKKSGSRGGDAYADRPPSRDFPYRDNDRRVERNGRGTSRGGRGDRGDGSAPGGSGRGRGRGGRGRGSRPPADTSAPERGTHGGQSSDTYGFEMEPPAFDAGPEQSGSAVNFVTPPAMQPSSLVTNLGVSWAAKLKESGARRPMLSPEPAHPPVQQTSGEIHAVEHQDWPEPDSSSQRAQPEQQNVEADCPDFGSGFGREQPQPQPTQHPPQQSAWGPSQDGPAWPAPPQVSDLLADQADHQAPQATYGAPPGMPATSQAYQNSSGVFDLGQLGSELPQNDGFRSKGDRAYIPMSSEEQAGSVPASAAAEYTSGVMPVSNALETLFPPQSFASAGGERQPHADAALSAQHRSSDVHMGSLGSDVQQQMQPGQLQHSVRQAAEQMPLQAGSQAGMDAQAPHVQAGSQIGLGPSAQGQVAKTLEQQAPQQMPMQQLQGSAPYTASYAALATAGSASGHEYLGDTSKQASPAPDLGAGHAPSSSGQQLEGPANSAPQHVASSEAERRHQEAALQAHALQPDMAGWGVQHVPPEMAYGMQRSAGTGGMPGLQSMMPAIQQVAPQSQLGQYGSMPGGPYGAPGFAPGYNAAQMGFPGYGVQPYNMPFNPAYPAGYQHFPAQYSSGPQNFVPPGSGYSNKAQAPYQADFSRGGGGGGGAGGLGAPGATRGGRGGRGPRPTRGRSAGTSSPGAEAPYAGGGAYGGYEQGWGAPRFDMGAYGKDKAGSVSFPGYTGGGMGGFDPYYAQQQQYSQQPQYGPQGWAQDKGYGKQGGY